jgi:hypothetical protein
VPYLFSTATKGASPVEAITAFLAELDSSSVPRDQDLVPAEPTASWPDAFRVLASVLPDAPVVVVLDELPWLINRRWASWRGRAAEPIIREALSLAAADLPWPEATAVGGWWNRAA